MARATSASIYPSGQTFCLLIFPQGVETEIVQMLDDLKVPGFTQTAKVTGRGPRGRHFDNSVWPGADGAIFTVVSHAQVAAVASGVRRMSSRLSHASLGLYGVRMFTWQCHQVA